MTKTHQAFAGKSPTGEVKAMCGLWVASNKLVKANEVPTCKKCQRKRS